MAASSLAAPTVTGKNKHNENFPVASVLVAPHLRGAVHVFYRFARAADDIADDPALPAEEKISRLKRFDAALRGADDAACPEAAALRDDIAARGLSVQPARDLLHAFMQDAVKNRYVSWQELLDYCRYSAAPVGRHVLALHGIGEVAWAANDALCALLQILNHLQDCAEDYRVMNRVYLPEDILRGNGAQIEELAEPHISTGLRAAVDQMLDLCVPLLETSATFPAQVPDFRLRLEVAVIHALAVRMTEKLRRTDPLAGQSKLSRIEKIAAVLRGLVSGVRGG